jgi:hypothetical protein
MSVDIFNLSEIFSLLVVCILALTSLLSVSKFFNISKEETLILFLYHTLLALIFLFVDLNHGHDANDWYNKARLDSIGYTGNQFMYFISGLLQSVGIKYLSQNMIFNYLGFLTLVIFYSKIKEFCLHQKKKEIFYVSIGLVFVPGFSFWTSGITKDVLSIFGLAILYLSVNNKINIKLLIISILFIFFSRPFILPFFGLSFLLYKFYSIIISNKLKLEIKLSLLFFITLLLCLLILSLNILSYYIPNFETSFNLIYIIKKITSYISLSQKIYAADYLGVPLDSYLHSRYFYFLYMPLKIDADNLFLIYFLIENIFLINLTLFMIFKFKYTPVKINNLCKVFYIGILLMFIYFPLALSNYGIAMRYKWLIIPYFILAFLQFRVYRKK